MMLPAAIEAPADFDVQILDRLVQLKTLLRQSVAQLRRHMPRTVVGIARGKAFRKKMIGANVSPNQAIRHPKIDAGAAICVTRTPATKSTPQAATGIQLRRSTNPLASTITLSTG